MHSFLVFLILLCSHAIASNSTSNSTRLAQYWLENIKHQGLSPFNPNASTYQVFRNVKDFGAKGDGITDDTAAINLAMSSGDRCAPGSCASSTLTPAVVYFPAGTYLLSASIIDYYFTQIIGNPNDLPVLKATSTFSPASSFGLIDSDQYGANGLQFGPTNLFYRQLRNFVLDMTDVPPSVGITGVHWPTAQATSLQNVVFLMSDAVGTQHQGIFIEQGSGGFMTDLVFHGGLTGVVFGNQQFTTRNLTFTNVVTAISQLWDWGWTYSGIVINNCSVGLDISGGGSAAQSVGSVTFIDSVISNTPVAILSAHNASSLPPTAGSVILENVRLNNVSIAVKGPGSSIVLRGTNGTRIISGWGQGHSYTPRGPRNFEGPISPSFRPSSLLKGTSFYTRSKPQYEKVPLSKFCSVRSEGAVGDGNNDDTKALQSIILHAAQQNKIVFFDAGTYKVTSTIYIPPNSKIVGETYPTIMGSGQFFSDMENPQPVIRVGLPSDSGSIEWSDMIISTQGATAGAVLIEWNLASPSTSPSGMWDVHARVGGFAGSDLQVAQCVATPESGGINPDCIAAFMTMHVTPTATGLYMENVWLWVADHDLEDPLSTQITIYNGRGLYVESEAGTIWLVGTAVEHHQLYQYQFANTKDIFMGQIQTETAYYQPSPNALLPFSPVASINDPDFAVSCAALPGNCDGWGLRIVDSDSILVYGAGLYSFFDNYNTSCSDAGNGEVCQNQIFSIEGQVSNIKVYNLNTVGVTNMITRNGTDVTSFADNLDGFPDTIALFASD